MANEKRQRLLSIVASGGAAVTLGASLSSQNQGYGDTVTLNNTLVYADGTAVSIASDQYLPVVVDPGTGNAEEMWLLGTPSGSPVTVSCVRGAGSSTGAPAHSNGALVVSGPTPFDRLLSYDDPWGGNLGYDYEFQGDGSSLPSYSFNGTSYPWSWFNQGSATYSEAWGRGLVSTPGTSGVSYGGIYQAVPSASSFTITAKLSVMAVATASFFGGLFVSDGTKYLSVGSAYVGSTYFLAAYGTSGTNYTGAEGTSILCNNSNNVTFYARITKNSSSSWTFSVSTDGLFFYPIASALNMPSSFFTPAYMGFGIDANNNDAAGISCQFLRVR